MRVVIIKKACIIAECWRRVHGVDKRGGQWAGQFSMEDFVEGVRIACLARDKPAVECAGALTLEFSGEEKTCAI